MLADPARRAQVHRRSSTCARRRRWPSCSPTCPRRWRTPWRSRGAAASTLKLGESRLPDLPGAGRHAPPMTTSARSRRAGLESAARAAAACRRRAARPREVYDQRLERELDVICKMGFAGYFLIVADFIRWARDNGVPVGSGPRLRRRLAGRVRARHHRPRPARARPAVRALPESRARVDAGLRHRLLHGRPRPRHRLRGARSTAASASRRSSPTARWRRRRWCATSAACSAIRYGFVDRIAKLIPFELGITLDDALDQGAGAASASTRPTTRCARSSTSRARSRASRATPASTPAAW